MRNIFLFAHVFFKEIVFAFTISFTFLEIMKVLVLVKLLSTTDFWNTHKHKLTRNARLFTSLGSARFKLTGSSFLVTFLVDCMLLLCHVCVSE